MGLFLDEKMLNNNEIQTDLLVIGTLWREYVRLISEYVSWSTSQSFYHFFHNWHLTSLASFDGSQQFVGSTTVTLYM